ncbi:hypothetical protein Pmani_012953 [Petrolisthes manimaculis]|uniref:Uncharacterized protein n=1 Tax=Petrolisthes manimaculis TaxID=1843537 RepID=A0AAE1NBL6_9EUCA|nr:hypothetical protein Pmani_040074 [Petrolisthes manimaculis]KAK4315836.1 hypothetical protein Pmani_012953 [Petrolisthes manimaculis]
MVEERCWFIPLDTNEAVFSSLTNPCLMVRVIQARTKAPTIPCLLRTLTVKEGKEERCPLYKLKARVPPTSPVPIVVMPSCCLSGGENESDDVRDKVRVIA